jgi:methylglutaconyl-CoA hydratase
LRVKEEKNVAYVTLDRPDVRNAFHPEMIQKLTEAFRNFSQRTDLRAIVLAGEGKAFCAGADLNWMKSMVHYTKAQNQEDSEKLFQMFGAIWSCPVPVVGYVHGAAFGGALGLIAACDYVIAEEKTQLCFSEVKLGIAPAVISAFILKKCAPGVVSHLMISGKVFAPKEVLGSGLVHESVNESQMPAALKQWLENLMAAGPEAVRETKKLIRKLTEGSLAAAQAETCRVIAERRVSTEGQEGLKSFLEKRSPSWKVSYE